MGEFLAQEKDCSQTEEGRKEVSRGSDKERAWTHKIHQEPETCLPLQRRPLMISPQGEHVRNQIKNGFRPLLMATLEIPLETRRPQFEALMSRTELLPDVEIEEVEAGGVPCEWVRISGKVPQ